MGPDENFLTQVGPGQLFVARVGSCRVQLSMLWVWKISLKNVKFSIFFPSGKKYLFGLVQKVPRSKAGQPLIYC